MKMEINPSSLKRPPLFPCPVVLVTCLDSERKANIITVTWIGIVCSDPPTLGLGIRPQRHSFKLIKNSEEFVVNIPTTAILKETDFCGIVSGKNVDKFLETGLTPEPARRVKPPLIRECPVNIECIVKKRIALGGHHLFLGQVVLVHFDRRVLDEHGELDFAKIAPFVYNLGEYWSINKRIGSQGFSKQ